MATLGIGLVQHTGSTYIFQSTPTFANVLYKINLNSMQNTTIPLQKWIIECYDKKICIIFP